MSSSYVGGSTSRYTLDTVQNGVFTLVDSNLNNAGTSWTTINPQTTVNFTMNYKSFDPSVYDGSLDSINNNPKNFNGSKSGLYYKISSTIPITTGLSSYTNSDKRSEFNNGANGWTLINNWDSTNNSVQQSGSQTLNIPANHYLTIALTGDGGQYSGIAITNFLSTTGTIITGVCLHPDTKILMENGEYKKICQIKRHDVVVQDLETKQTAVVSNVYSKYFSSKCVVVKKGLFGNLDDIICTENNPFWLPDNSFRIYPKNILNVEKKVIDVMFYNLQFDEEGTFIAEGVKIDSLSPYNKRSRLPLELFIDKTKFIPNRKITDENQPDRNKPFLKPE